VVKLLKCLALVINSVLLTAGIIIAVFGIILWKTDMNTFGDEVKSLIPDKLKEKTGETPEVPGIFIWLGKLVMSFGLIIVGLTIVGIFALTCCSNKCNSCLVVYLILLIVLTIVQIAVVILSYNTSSLETEVKKSLKPIFLDATKRNSSYEFILGTQTFLKCCAVDGFKDYYCKDVYDPFCNFGCKSTASDPKPLKMDGSALPVCPVNQRKAEGNVKTGGVCAGENARENTATSSATPTAAPTDKGRRKRGSLLEGLRQANAKVVDKSLSAVGLRGDANKKDVEAASSSVDLRLKAEAADPNDFPGEPRYDRIILDIPDKLLKTKDGGIAEKPSDFPGCGSMVFDEINDNLKYVQITCLVILGVELFLMLVTIILICKNKKGGQQNSSRGSSSSRGTSSRSSR